LQQLLDNIFPRGVYTFQCHDKDGNLLWEDTIHNLVTTVGANEILDKAFAGSGYTATNYMGLISSVSYGAGVVNGDTMASHAGWVEAGGTNAPAYTGSRPTCAWSAASARSKSLSSPLSFTFTSPGTLKGSFITTVATKDGATGIIISGGTFTGGDQPVASGNTVTAGYSLSM
jgi:hypothetical protein